MKFKILLIIPMFFKLTCLYSQEITFPPPKGYVSDYANIIDPETESRLEVLINSLNKKTTAEIAVVTLNSIAPYDIEYYAVKLFENWGIGQKEKDNGVLLLVALKERKVRIEVGYGLEGALPDIISKQIIEKFIVPYFRKGNFSQGVYAGVNQIVKYLAKEYGMEPQDISGYTSSLPPEKNSGVNILGFLIYLILMFIFIRIFGIFGIFFFPFGGYRGGYWGSGGGGFGGFGGFGGGLSGGGGASGSW